MIDAPLAAFLQEGLGIHVGTRDVDLRPNGARGLAILIEPDGLHLTVYLARVALERLLPDLQSNGAVAVSVGRPIDERACQVKGVFTGLHDPSPPQREQVAAQVRAYGTSLEQIGIPRVMTSGWTTEPVVGIRLRATAVFEQTPRPGTGERLA